MKKLLAMAFAVLTVSTAFAGCQADPGDTTKDGFIGDQKMTAQKITFTVEDPATATGNTAKEIRTNVADYYRARHWLYSDSAQGTIGFDYAAGYEFSRDDASNRYYAGRMTAEDENNYTQNGVVIDKMDTNANLASNPSTSTQISDPKSPSGLVRNGSDNIE